MARVLEKLAAIDASTTIDWTGQLGGATISSSSWTLPTGLTETTSSNTTSTSSLTVGGGTDGVAYSVTNEVTLSAGGPLTETVYVYIRPLVFDEVEELPVSVEEVKHSLRVTINDDDEYIRELIGAAVRYIEQASSRDFMRRIRTINCPEFPNDGFSLQQTPVDSVHIQYYDSDDTLQTLASSVFSVYDAPDGATHVELAVNQSWPSTSSRSDAVQMVVFSGYRSKDTVPKLAKTAIRMLVRHWYDNAAGGVTGQIFTVTDPGIKSLIWSLKTGSYGITSA